MRTKLLRFVCHAVIWAAILSFFFRNSFLRPYSVGATYKEYIVAAFIVFSNYFILLFLYPAFFQKERRILFWLLSAITVLVISIAEVMLVRPNIVQVLPMLDESGELIRLCLRVFYRDAGIILFFVLMRLYTSAVESSQLLAKNFEVERLYLSSKIAPHYLSNAILSIQRKAYVENEEVANLLGQLNSIVQYLIKQSVKDTVLLSDEIDFYRDYVLLEQDRFPDERKIDFKLSLENVNRTAELAPLLLEPIICNAFKYSPHDGTGYVFLTVSQPDSNTLLFICTNNIINEKFHCKGCGSSLENLRKRLELCYPGKHELCVSEQNGIFTAKLKIAII